MNEFDFLRDLFKTLEAYEKQDNRDMAIPDYENVKSSKEKIKLAKEEGTEIGFLKGVRQQNQQFAKQVRNIIIAYLELS